MTPAEARPRGWTAEDHARWWSLQPECGETSKHHIEALLDTIAALSVRLAQAEQERVEAGEKARAVLAASGGREAP